MNHAADSLVTRLNFILHFGICEIRKLALANEQGQIADLADALEFLPKYLKQCSEEDAELIRFALKCYQEKYPGGSFDYVAHLDELKIQERI